MGAGFPADFGFGEIPSSGQDRAPEPPSPYTDQLEALLDIRPPEAPDSDAAPPSPGAPPEQVQVAPSESTPVDPGLKRRKSFEIERPPTEEIDSRTRSLEEEKFRKEQEERQQRQEYEAVLENSQFSAILPLGKRIHFDATCEVLARHLDIDPSAAKRKVRRGKGIVLRDLSYDEMVEFYHSLLDCPQKIVFVRQSEELDYGAVQPMLSAQPLDRNAKVATERGLFRVEWEHVKLISAGWVRTSRTSEEQDLVADFFIQSPSRHLRLYDNTFSYRSWYGQDTPPPEDRFRILVLQWAHQCPSAQLSHTIQLVTKEQLEDFQVFSSINEFDNYNRWLILGHFGEQIDPARKRSKAATNF